MSLTGKQGKWLYHYLHYEFWKDSKEVLRTVVYLLLLRESTASTPRSLPRRFS